MNKTTKLSKVVKKEGALMIKRRAISLIIVVALVIGMLPLGALTAFAASTASPSSPTAKVITGAGGTEVKDQPADDITIKEDTADDDAWGTADLTVRLTPTANVKFTSKPTVSVNGTALSSSQVTLPTARDYIEFKMNGDNAKFDQIVVSGIKYDLGAVAAGNVDVTITGIPGGNLHAYNAKVQEGLVMSAAAATEVKAADTAKPFAAVTLTESTKTIAKKDDFITLTAPAGVTFYEPPVAVATTLTVYSATAELNPARTEAKWQLSGASTSTAGNIVVTGKINVASDFAADTDIKFTGKTSSSDYAVAPASVKVAKSSAADALKFEAAAAPTISNDVNQVAANITITETSAGKLKTGDDTLAVELVSGTFASSPIATPSGAGLTLKNAAGDAVKTAVAGKLSGAGSTKATWSVADQSTAAGNITISGIAINATNLSDGPVKVKIYGGVVGLLPSEAKILTIANVSTTQTIKLSTSSVASLAVGAASQKAGDIIITETKKGAITQDSTITLSIFGNTADKEVLFAEAPAVNVTAGNADVGTVTLASDKQSLTFKLTKASTEASTIKVSGIKYDINSKAKNGAVQIIVTDDDTRLGAVTNGSIGAAAAGKFPDVTSAHWAFNAVEYLASQSIVTGRTSGQFDPAANVTRAEFAKIVCLAAGLTTVTTATPTFGDTSGHWALGYIEAAKKAGIIGGYSDGTFRPNAKITRAEIAKMVVVAAKFTVVTSGGNLSDVSSNWAKDYITTAASKGIVTGYTDGTFRPSNNSTRAESCQMVYKWLVP